MLACRYLFIIPIISLLFVVDALSPSVDWSTPRGVKVSTLAGSGKYGFADGEPHSAMFRDPGGITADVISNDTFYVSDNSNHRLRVITLAAAHGSQLTALNVSTLAGTGNCGSADGAALQATLCHPNGMAADLIETTTLYVCDYWNNRVRVITLNAISGPPGSPRSALSVSTLVGNGTAGHVDGNAQQALLHGPVGIVFDPHSNNTLYITELDNNCIRVITLAPVSGPAGTPRLALSVSTLVGNGTAGHVDGSALLATFHSPTGIALDTQSNGTLFVAERDNNCIRIVTFALLANGTRTSATVTTLAGNGAFHSPFEVRRIDNFLFVADADNNRIRLISLTNATNVNGRVSAIAVMTLVGDGTCELRNGAALHARLCHPYGILRFSRTTVLVTDYTNTIRAITLSPMLSMTLTSSVSVYLSPSITTFTSRYTGLSTGTLATSSFAATSRFIPSTTITFTATQRASTTYFSSSTSSQSTVVASKFTASISPALTSSPRQYSASVSYCDVPHNKTSLTVISRNTTRLCEIYLCPSVLSVRSVRFAFDDLFPAPSFVLVFDAAQDDLWFRSQWRWYASINGQPLRATELPLNKSIALLIERPFDDSPWPDLANRPYATQRLSLSVSVACASNASNLFSFPIILSIDQRDPPVAQSVQIVVQSSQTTSGATGSGAEALTVGRLAVSLTVLSCDDVLKGSGAGVGVLSLTSEGGAAVDTIAGNTVFVFAVFCFALAGSGLLHSIAAPSGVSLTVFLRDVLRLPLSLFSPVAATLPSTVMAIVAVLRDATTEGFLWKEFLSTVMACFLWSGCLVLVSAAVRRMARVATLRPLHRHEGSSICGLVAAATFVRAAVSLSHEWVVADANSPTLASDVALFEGTRVLWLVPLDIGVTMLMSLTSALPISSSASLCIGVNALNTFGCAALLVVNVLFRPQASPFGQVHAVLSSLLVFVTVASGLIFVVAANYRGDSTGGHLGTALLIAIQYMSGGAAALSILRALVDVSLTVVATRERFRDAVSRSNIHNESAVASLGVEMLASLSDDDVHSSASSANCETTAADLDFILHPPPTDLEVEAPDLSCDPLYDLLTAYDQEGEILIDSLGVNSTLDEQDEI